MFSLKIMKKSLTNLVLETLLAGSLAISGCETVAGRVLDSLDNSTKVTREWIDTKWDGNHYTGEAIGYGQGGSIWQYILDGRGTIRLANGDSYEGEFSKGTYNGYGKYTHRNGMFQEGYFDHNNYIGKKNPNLSDK